MSAIDKNLYHTEAGIQVSDHAVISDTIGIKEPDVQRVNLSCHLSSFEVLVWLDDQYSNQFILLLIQYKEGIKELGMILSFECALVQP